jgi:hypothetical protein
MFLSLDYVITAINNLSTIHPFYGITFLSCKKNNLPVGNEIEYSMDSNTRALLVEIHKINPSSEFFYQPYSSNSKDRHWVTPKYPSAGLQAINTQTYVRAFIHTTEKTWGWANNYVDVITSKLKGNRRIPIIDLAIWIFKYKNWPENSSLQTIIDFFMTSFNVNDSERSKIFSDAIIGYPVSNPFQPAPITWSDLSTFVAAPPDAAPSRGATLSYLELSNIGPTSSITIEPNQRLNILTGDNGLGKSFIMECAWWALTGTWPDSPALPIDMGRNKATITYELASGTGLPLKKSVNYDSKQGNWPRDKKSPSIPGLIVYGRVDGSYAVWDPVKQYSTAGKPRRFVFDRNEVWDGVTGSIEGLMRDWIKWQNTPDKYPFAILEEVLKKMSPPDMGELKPGKPIRMINDIRDIPTIIHPYGEVPINNSSAGVRRIITLAYLVVWAWNEHKVGADLLQVKPENRMVILVDEIEAHLHPRWQRTILPALLQIQNILSSELEIQFIISTHSPLVLASIETYFNEPTDKLFHLYQKNLTGEAEC